MTTLHTDPPDCCARDFALAMNWVETEDEAIPDWDDYYEDEQ